MSRPAPIHICFYSNRCDWSKAFIEEISKTAYHTHFRFICVDPSANRPALPSWLKQTPTLVVSGEPEPRVNSEVMNWLYEQKLKDGGAPKGGGGLPGPVDPEPYLGTDTSAQGDGGMSMKHNFTYLNGQDGVSTREASTFQSTQSDQKRSKKEQLFDQQYEQLMKNRDNGIPQRVARQ